jgi:short-subunit dehydrogenase
MNSKIVVITGASDGIGAVAAHELHRMGTTVVIIGRSPEKIRRIADELHAKYYIADFAKLNEEH